MKFLKKLFIVLIWIFLLNIFVMLAYGFFYENDASKLKEVAVYKFRFHTRTIAKTSLEYDKFNDAQNVVSKNNISIKLADINYEKASGNLKLNFEFYTNDKQNFDRNIGTILRIYDDNNLFYNFSLGNLSTENKELLLEEKKYKELDDSLLDESSNFEIMDSEQGYCKKVEINLNLGKDYQILNALNIEFQDFTYRTEDEFLVHRAIEPMGEYKFIVNF